MIMNETGNVYGAVLLNYSKFFIKLNKLGAFLKNEFIYGGHWLSLGGSAFAISIMLMLNTVFKFELILIVYLLCHIVYNFDHYRNLEQDKHDNPKRSNHLKKYQKLFPILFSIYVCLFIGLLWYFGNLLSLSVGILILIIGFLYSIGLKNLTKKIIGFKNIYTSFSVSMLVILISFHIGISLNLSAIIIFIFIFLRLLINSSFCDLKDMNSDRKKNLKTLPIYFGKRRFLSFLHIINLLSLLLIVIGIISGALPIFVIIILLSFPIVLFYLNKAKNPNVNIENLTSVFVDGEFILWPLILIGGQYLLTLL